MAYFDIGYNLPATCCATDLPYSARSNGTMRVGSVVELTP